MKYKIVAKYWILYLLLILAVRFIIHVVVGREVDYFCTLPFGDIVEMVLLALLGAFAQIGYNVIVKGTDYNSTPNEKQ